MHEMAVEYKVKFRSITSYFNNDIDIEKDYFSKLIAGKDDTPYQIYDFEMVDGIINAHFHIYFPFNKFEGNSFFASLSSRTEIIDFDELDVREQHI